MDVLRYYSSIWVHGGAVMNHRIIRQESQLVGLEKEVKRVVITNWW
jgi:hypothetical protein